MTALDAWVGRITDGASDRKIADQLGIAGTMFSRWKRLNSMPAPRVIELARAFRADCIEGLVAAGYLTADEAHSAGVQSTVRDATDKSLIEELHRRMIERELLDGVAEFDPRVARK
jgi:hypothetical protein